MNIHIFQDSLGHYISATYSRVSRLNKEYHQEILFINISNNKITFGEEKIILLPENWNNIRDFIKGLVNVENVYFHNYNFLSQFILDEIVKYHAKVEFNWIFWSAEFYNLPEISYNFYIGKSSDFHLKNNTLHRIKNNLFQFKEMLLGRPYYSHKSFIKSFRKINNLITFFNSDYTNIVEYSKASFKLKTFAYLSFEQFFGVQSSLNGDPIINIMINHNGDPILNHFDVFDRLYFLDKRFKIILPIAYGSNKYINEIIEYCSLNLINTNYEFWDKFIPAEEYSKKLLEINVAIFNFSVQKGVGNILPLLWSGCKIFLRDECPIYIDFKKFGFAVFSIQGELNIESLVQPLSGDLIGNNRRLVNELFSDKAVDSYYRNCFFS